MDLKQCTVTPNNIYDVISPALACLNADPPTKSGVASLPFYFYSNSQPLSSFIIVGFLRLIVFSQEAALKGLVVCHDEEFPSVSMRENLLHLHIARFTIHHQHSPLSLPISPENDHTCTKTRAFPPLIVFLPALISGTEITRPDHLWAAGGGGTEEWNGADVKTVRSLRQAKPNRLTVWVNKAGPVRTWRWSYLLPFFSALFN